MFVLFVASLAAFHLSLKFYKNTWSAKGKKKRAQMKWESFRHPKEGRFLISHSINHPLSAQHTISVAHSLSYASLGSATFKEGNLKAFCTGGATPLLEHARVETANVKASFSSCFSPVHFSPYKIPKTHTNQPYA